MKKLKKKQRREIRRIGEYLISGGAYFWSGYLMFFVLDQLVGLNLWWAKLFANITGWVVNYVLQRYWVFNQPGLKKEEEAVTVRYAIITLVNFVLDYFIVAGLKSIGITPYIGQFISSGFFTVWNYLWYKLWVFRRSLPIKRRTPKKPRKTTKKYHNHPGVPVKKVRRKHA